jgi:hypothetical protein
MALVFGLPMAFIILATYAALWWGLTGLYL